MSDLKLIALDVQDLDILSAHVQDAVLKVEDLVSLPRQKRFAMAMNRFVWEKKPRWFRRENERRRSALHFDRVEAVRYAAIPRDRPDHVLSLLAIRFTPVAEPAGHVDLLFAGGGAIRLEVECLEAQLADLGPAWDTQARPHHD